jgi:hypothetical protein
MTQTQKEIIYDLINNMATYSNGKACYFDQSGYDFVDSNIDFYMSPSDYKEILHAVFM